MNEFDNIFTFRDNTYSPPSDYLIKDDDDMGDFEVNEEDIALLDVIIGFNHIVWN
jgi:hypothetical protein